MYATKIRIGVTMKNETVVEYENRLLVEKKIRDCIQGTLAKQFKATAKQLAVVLCLDGIAVDTRESNDK